MRLEASAMFRILVLSSLTAASFGCTHPAKPQAAATSPGKQTAPVDIANTFDGRTAHVKVTFTSAVENAAIHVSGVDGFTVTGGASDLTGLTLARGETRQLDVTFAPGEGESHLVVRVEGQFGGELMHRIATFSVGSKTALQKPPGTVTTTDDGARVKVMNQ
jgi:hypothetical protein